MNCLTPLKRPLKNLKLQHNAVFYYIKNLVMLSLTKHLDISTSLRFAQYDKEKIKEIL